ncbi:MAG: carbohydrate-binding family 9-like protein [Armatimonadetes bacterium]|nr:carbohydrate-binding family 9-like protein [Armatimonadota bacterium]
MRRNRLKWATAGVGLLAVAAMAVAPWGEPFSAAKDQAYTCARADGRIIVDGKLDEPAWAGAQVIRDFVSPPHQDPEKLVPTAPYRAHSQTFARLLWDDQKLYLGAELMDGDLYCDTPAGHNHSFAYDDIVELFVKPRDDQPFYWEFHVVPSGGTRSYFYARRGAGGDKRWMIPNPGMVARVKLNGTLNSWQDRDGQWTAEVAIPWTAFARTGGRPGPGDLWRFMVARYDYSVQLEEGCELSAAAPLPYTSFHLFEHYPYMAFKAR